MKTTITQHPATSDILIFNNVIIAYPKIFEPSTTYDAKPDDRKVFSCTMLADKETDLTLYNKMITDLIALKVPEKELGIVKVREPKMDGDIQDLKHKFNENYSGHWYFNAKSAEDRPPVIVDCDGVTALHKNSGKLYGGCIVNIQVAAWFFTTKGLGIAFDLLGIQYVAEGIRIGSAPVPRDTIQGGFIAVNTTTDDPLGGI